MMYLTNLAMVADNIPLLMPHMDAVMATLVPHGATMPASPMFVNVLRNVMTLLASPEHLQALLRHVGAVTDAFMISPWATAPESAESVLILLETTIERLYGFHKAQTATVADFDVLLRHMHSAASLITLHYRQPSVARRGAQFLANVGVTLKDKGSLMQYVAAVELVVADHADDSDVVDAALWYLNMAASPTLGTLRRISTNAAAAVDAMVRHSGTVRVVRRAVQLLAQLSRLDDLWPALRRVEAARHVRMAMTRYGKDDVIASFGTEMLQRLVR